MWQLQHALYHTINRISSLFSTFKTILNGLVGTKPSFPNCVSISTLALEMRAGRHHKSPAVNTGFLQSFKQPLELESNTSQGLPQALHACLHTDSALCTLILYHRLLMREHIMLDRDRVTSLLPWEISQEKRLGDFSHLQHFARMPWEGKLTCKEHQSGSLSFKLPAMPQR